MGQSLATGRSSNGSRSFGCVETTMGKTGGASVVWGAGGALEFVYGGGYTLALNEDCPDSASNILLCIPVWEESFSYSINKRNEFFLQK